MSALTPVSFSKAKAPEPRLSPPRTPGGSRTKRFWTPEEDQILTENYPKGGAPLCQARLPGRALQRIYQRAHFLKLKAPTSPVDRKRITPPEDADAIIKARWPETAKRGGRQKLAADLGVPEYWVSKRAAKLQLTVAYKKEPAWTDAEKALMKRIPLHDLFQCGNIFREHGFSRTPTAIGVMAKRLNLSRRATHEKYSGTAAAALLGLDNKTVTAWCVSGELKATRRNDKRLPQQGGSTWEIAPADLRAWIIENIARFDIRKVDKVAFLNLWAGPVADAEKSVAFVRALAGRTPGKASAAQKAAAYDGVVADAVTLVQSFAGDRQNKGN